MATAAAPAPSANRNTEVSDVSEFEPVLLSAPFALRCAALSIDYIVLLIVPALWLVSGRLVSDRGAAISMGIGVWLIAAAVLIINSLLLPLFRGQSLGKLVTGLTIVHLDGKSAGTGRLLLRNSLGYLITLLSGGLGFFVAAFNESGRTLHDVLAGTLVIKGRQS